MFGSRQVNRGGEVHDWFCTPTVPSLDILGSKENVIEAFAMENQELCVETGMPLLGT